MKKYIMKYLSDKISLFFNGYKTVDIEEHYLDINDRFRVAVFKQRKAPYTVHVKVYDTMIKNNRCVVFESSYSNVISEQFIVSKAKLGIFSVNNSVDNTFICTDAGWSIDTFYGSTFHVIDLSGDTITSKEYAIDGIQNPVDYYDKSVYSLVGYTPKKDMIVFDKKLNVCEEHVKSFDMIHVRNEYGNSEKKLMVFSYTDGDMKIAINNELFYKCNYVEYAGHNKEMPLIAITEGVSKKKTYQKFIPAKFNYTTFDDCPVFRKIKKDNAGNFFMVQDLETGNWGFINYTGKIVVPLEYKNLTPMHLNRTFGNKKGGLVMIDSKGHEYPHKYRRLVKNFDAIIYGTGAKTFALVEDYDGPFYIDTEGSRYKIFDPKVLEQL